jgi:hypothetical protein
MNPASGSSAPDGAPVHAALLLDNDLFFSVKIADTLKHVGYRTRTVRALDAFAQALAADQPPTVALVNTGARSLDWRAAITAARRVGVPTIAFGSHVDMQTQQEARDLGATSVIANSKLASDLPGVVARTLRREDGVPYGAHDASDQEK